MIRREDGLPRCLSVAPAMAARLSGFSFHGHIIRDAEKASLTLTDTLHYCCAPPQAPKLTPRCALPRWALRSPGFFISRT